MIKPLAFDSFSVRSMATSVVAGKHKVVIDPGIALGPQRFGLEPSDLEYKALEDGERIIKSELRDADIVTISHYHFDHHPFYDDESFNRIAYKDKTLIVKDSKTKINLSQKKRAFVFEKIASKLASKILKGDSKEFNFDSLNIKCSKPVFHGSTSRLGYVIMVKLSYKNDSLMHCSDIQGPIVEETARVIIKENPRTLIIGGPPTYLLGFRMSYKDLERAKNNVLRIITKTNVKDVIIDHHLLRDLKFRERFNIYEKAKQLGCELKTAAEFLGIENKQLEARRRELSK